MVRYCYTIGSPSSGSTLLVLLLHAHPDIASMSHMNGPNSTEDRESYICSCGTPIGKCEFYNELFRRMHARGIVFDLHHWTSVYWMEEQWYLRQHELLNRFALQSLRSNLLESIRDIVLSPWPARRRAIRRADRATVAQAEISLEILGRKVWIDGTNHPIRLRYLRRIPELDLRVVHLVRDPRGVCASWVRQRKVSWAGAAKNWVQAAKNSLRAMRLIPRDRQMILRYETLCQKPTETVDRIAAFLGLTPMGSYDFAAEGHHLVGNLMRIKTLEIREDERWKSEIPPKELARIIHITGPMARRYGYDL